MNMRSFIDELLEEDDAGRRESVRARLRVDVTEQINVLLEQRGLTRAELARRLGVTRASVTQALTGSRNLSLNTLADMADALHLDVRVALQPRMLVPVIGADNSCTQMFINISPWPHAAPGPNATVSVQLIGTPEAAAA